MSTTPATESMPPTPSTHPLPTMPERVPEDRKAKLAEAARSARELGTPNAVLDYMRQKRTPAS